MKKAAIFFIQLLSLCSCNGFDGVTHKLEHTQFKKNENLNNLYDVTYNDYSYEDVKEYLEGTIPNNPNNNAGGCSSVRNGNYFGRSFDYFYIDVPNFLLSTPHTNQRFASIGVSSGDFSLTVDRINKINAGNRTNKDILDEKLLPFTMLDGINENGVVINSNVVPAHDLPARDGENTYVTRCNNPGKEDMHIQFLIRYVLDYAKSAQHAIELLGNFNITGFNSKGELRDYCGLYKIGYELHFMIADKFDTYIIEFVNDKMSVISGNIMTNFYLSMLTPSSAGIERYQILYKNYLNVNTCDDMKSLIKRVQYSNTYNTELGYAIWPSEISSQEIPYYNTKQFFQDNWTNIKPIFDEQYNIIKNGQKASAPGDGVPWVSSHSEVYDIENKILNICTQENYNNWQSYSL